MPAGIACGTGCSASYAFGTMVTLTATAGAESLFQGWTGACTSATGSCVVAMSGARSVQARFELNRNDLPAGVWLCRIVGLGIQVLCGGRRLVHERTAVRMNVRRMIVGRMIVLHSMLG